jgi:hypothetical protein
MIIKVHPNDDTEKSAYFWHYILQSMVLSGFGAIELPVKMFAFSLTWQSV